MLSHETTMILRINSLRVVQRLFIVILHKTNRSIAVHAGMSYLRGKVLGTPRAQTEFPKKGEPFVILHSRELLVEWLKHDDTVRFRSRRSDGEKTQINLWRGGDFKERIKAINRPSRISVEFVSMTGENFWEASGQSKESLPPATGSSGATRRRDEKINRSTDRSLPRSRLRDRVRRCPLERRSVSRIRE